MCDGQITTETCIRNLKGIVGFRRVQTVSKTGVPLKRLTELTRLSSWAVSPHIPWSLHSLTHTNTRAQTHAADGTKEISRTGSTSSEPGFATTHKPPTHTQTHKCTTSRAAMTFSHVPLLVRVLAYGSYKRPRGKQSPHRKMSSSQHG